MTILAIQHAFQGQSGLPEDRFVNTVHATTLVEPLSLDLAAVATAMKEFYKPPAAPGISIYISHQAVAIGRTVKIYDLADGKPRAPIYEEQSAVPPFTAAVVNSFPAEVACCLSYDAPKVSGIAQARRRGRMFIGPLNTNATVNTSSQAPRPSPTFQADLNLAAETLRDDFMAAGVIWVVYSPTNDPGGTGDLAGAAVVYRSWVDDAFDTQRRRGPAATTKTVRMFA